MVRCACMEIFVDIVGTSMSIDVENENLLWVSLMSNESQGKSLTLAECHSTNADGVVYCCRAEEKYKSKHWSSFACSSQMAHCDQ